MFYTIFIIFKNVYNLIVFLSLESFSKHFSGIVSTTPAGPQRIKGLFDSINKANT